MNFIKKILIKKVEKNKKKLKDTISTLPDETIIKSINKETNNKKNDSSYLEILKKEADKRGLHY